MKITFGIGLLLALITYSLVFVIIALILSVSERTEKLYLKIAVYLVGFALMVGALWCNKFWFDSAEVIRVGGRFFTFSSWRFYYPADKRHHYPVHPGRMYLYNGMETDTNLVLTPVYYHRNPDSLGRKVLDRLPLERVQPGFHELAHPPKFIFHAPDSVFEIDIWTDEKIVYHLGREGEDDVPDYYLKLIYAPPHFDLIQ